MFGGNIWRHLGDYPGIFIGSSGEGSLCEKKNENSNNANIQLNFKISWLFLCAFKWKVADSFYQVSIFHLATIQKGKVRDWWIQRVGNEKAILSEPKSSSFISTWLFLSASTCTWTLSGRWFLLFCHWIFKQREWSFIGTDGILW